VSEQQINTAATYVFPASYAQQRMWLLDRLEPGAVTYNIPLAFRMKGVLDREALEKSINEIIRRHETLRTSFDEEAGNLNQVIHAEARLSLAVEEVHGTTASQIQHRVEEITSKEAATGFDLGKWPLIRARLLRLAEQEHLLILVMHHIISDGWSLGVLLGELGSLYDSFCRGEESELDELPVQYADYAQWQRQWLESGELERQMKYWRERMRGAPPVLEMPTDYARPAVQSYRGSAESLVISQEVTQKLKHLGGQEGVTLFMILLGAFDVLLSRYSGQQDIVVGTPIANRREQEIAGLIGCFANTLVIRVAVDEKESFRQLLKKVKEVGLGAYANQDVPFEKLVEELQPERDFSRSPIFQVMFVLQNGLSQILHIRNLQITPIAVGAATAKYEIEIMVAEMQKGISGRIECHTDLYKRSTIKRMARQFERLALSIAEDPDRSISQLDLLAPSEKHLILQEWNDTSTVFPTDILIHELFEQQARLTPDAVAVVCQPESLTYKELNEQANQLAHYLIEAGAGPEVIVGICLQRSIELIVSLLAVLKSGAAYLPLDPAYPEQRLLAIAEDAQLKLAICNKQSAELLNPVETIIELGDQRAAIAARAPSTPSTTAAWQNLAYVIYTSGTTGKPKGVAVEHRQLVNYALAAAERLKLSEVKRFAAASTVAADLGNTVIYGALITGGELHLLDEDQISDGVELGRYMQEADIECIKIVPSHLEALVAMSRNAVARKKVIVGGEAIGWSLVEVVRQATEGVQIYNHYGPTETTVGVIAGEIAEKVEDREGAARERITLGRPMANARMYILDGAGSEVATGAIGELSIGGAGVGRGYLNDAGLTAERFVPDGIAGTGERVYRTGDRMRWRADGELEFLGRVDGQVKLRGYRIETGEVESVLLQHEAVRQCAVLPQEDEAGRKYLAGYVVGLGNEPLSSAELRKYLRLKLPEYAIPSVYVTLEGLPLTSNGKLDRRALPIPSRGEEETAAARQGPRTAIEEMLEGIWCQVLKRERVGIEDNFFDIGGHSLIAMQVISRAQEVFKVGLSVRNIFESPTIAELAREIEALGRGEVGLAVAPLGRAPRNGAMPLSFTQKGLWFFHQLEPGTSYNIPVAIRFNGQLNISALVQGLNEIVRRHEALRTILPTVDGEPFQLVRPHTAPPPPLVDLSSLPQAQRDEMAHRLLKEETGRPFDLAAGPLLRIFLLQLGQGDLLMLLTMHHTVSDGWSGGVLFQELSALYSAFVAAETSPLPELSIQYADFAYWQHESLQGELYKSDLQYWKHQLGGAPAEVGFPTDRPRPAVLDSHGAVEVMQLPTELCRAVKEMSKRENVSVYMMLLAAFKILLHRYSGQTDIVIGSPIAGRSRAELEPLIGFFINTLVIRTDLSGDPSFRELLKRVREVTLGAYSRQDLPFEKLVEELEPERSLSRTPLFQLMFALQNVPPRILRLPGLEAQRLMAEPSTERFDLRLVMLETGRGIVGSISYNLALFEATTIRRMIRHYVKLLEAATAAPHLKISELPLLSELELHQLLREWSRFGAVEDRSQRIHDLVPHIKSTPDALSVEFEHERLPDRPTPDALIYVLDRNLQPVPIGVVGDLYAGGANVSRGRFDDEQAASNVVPDPFAEFADADMYKTGVQGRFLPTGAIECLGGLGHKADVEESVAYQPAELERGVVPDSSRSDLGQRRAELAMRRAKLPAGKESLLKQWLQEPQ
jgi:amino acid adenylation domain-containing protein